jgi:hypothetical protein
MQPKGVQLWAISMKKRVYWSFGRNALKDGMEERHPWVQDTMVKGLSLDESKLTDRVVFCRYP